MYSAKHHTRNVTQIFEKSYGLRNKKRFANNDYNSL